MEHAKLIEAVRAASQEGAEKGTKKALERLGFDVDEHTEVQQDMAFLRRQRKASERLGQKIQWTVIAALISGGGAALWIGLQTLIQKPPAP